MILDIFWCCFCCFWWVLLNRRIFFTSKIIKIYTNSKMMAAYTISAVGSSSPFHSKTTLRLEDNSNAMLSFLYKKERKQTNKQTKTSHNVIQVFLWTIRLGSVFQLQFSKTLGFDSYDSALLSNLCSISAASPLFSILSSTSNFQVSFLL